MRRKLLRLDDQSTGVNLRLATSCPDTNLKQARYGMNYLLN